MITLREVLVFLAPAFAGAVFAVVIFQILDRLNLFYQRDHNRGSQTASGRSVAA